MRNKRINRYMSMAAVFAVCSALVSCSNTGSVDSDKSGGSSASQTVQTEKTVNGGSYKALPQKFPEEIGTILSVKETSGGTFITAYDKDDKKLMFRSNEDFSEYQKYELREYKDSDVIFAAPAAYGKVYVLVISVAYKGLPEPDYDDPDTDWQMYNEAAVYSMALDAYDENGKYVSSSEISGLEENFISSENYISGFEAAPDGNLAVCSGTKIAKLSTDGRVIDTAELPGEYIYTCGLDSEGILVCVSSNESETQLQNFDMEKMELISTDSLGSSVYISSVTPGKDGYRLFLSLDEGIYGMPSNGRSLYKLVDKVDAGIKYNGVDYIIGLGDNEFAIAGNYNDGENRSTWFFYIKPRTEQEIKETQVITLGNLGADQGVLDAVIDFNNTNDGGYHIEVVSDYGAADKDEIGEAFNKAIISGDAPDIICVFDYTVLENLASKGAFADMYPYLDSDETLSRDDFLPNFLAVNETGGKLTMLPECFCVNTILAKTRLMNGVGDNWTMSDMLAAEKSLSDDQFLFTRASDASQVLREVVFHTTSCYIDYENRTCSFDSDEFVKLLELASSMNYAERDESESDWDRESYLNNTALIYPLMIHGSSDYEYIKKEYFGGEDLTFLGYPSDDGKGGSFFFSNTFAVMESSEHKDGAWAFIREFFLDEHQESLKNTYFPSVKKHMDCGDAQLESYIESISKVGTFDYDIYNIIEDEAAYYFNGEHTAQQAADLIQNRVSILISEQS